MSDPDVIMASSSPVDDLESEGNQRTDSRGLELLQIQPENRPGGRVLISVSWGRKGANHCFPAGTKRHMLLQKEAENALSAVF